MDGDTSGVTANTSTALLGPGTRATTIVRAALATIAVFVFIATDIRVTTIPAGIDVMIPLAAAERWMAGGVAYLPDGFTDPSVLPPFLYPPFVLPILTPLTALPMDLVRLLGPVLALALALAVCRRLAIGWAVVPFVLLWEPMFGAVWGGNVQILLFAAFVATFWLAPTRHDLQPQPRELDAPGALTPRIGWYAATVASVKATQLQAWLAVACDGPRGRPSWASFRGSSSRWSRCPFVGLGTYLDWVGQLADAFDPTWPAMGPVRCFRVRTWDHRRRADDRLVRRRGLGRGRDTGAWIGLMMLVVAPNMHDFQGMSAPGDAADPSRVPILAAVLTATATAEGWWLGIGVVVGVMLAGLRWPVAYEPIGPPAGPPSRSFVPVGGRQTRCYAAPAVRLPLLLYGLALAVRVVLDLALPYPAYPDSSYYVDVAEASRTAPASTSTSSGSSPRSAARSGRPHPADPLERALDAARLDGPSPVPRAVRGHRLGIGGPVRHHRVDHGAAHLGSRA